MRKIINELEANKSTTCEGLGCYSEATNKVAARIGHQGHILLYLCNRCAQKFCEG